MIHPGDLDALRIQMHARYGTEADAVRYVWSPYRICPLGAHIDHQLGTVTAVAIDRGVVLAYAASGSTEVRLSSLSFPNEVRFHLDRIPDRRMGDWGDYARGAAWALQRTHRLSRGLVGVTSGALAEMGLSSSASVGVAYLLALEQVNELTVPPLPNIRLDQAIENQYLGLKNGILDQTTVLLSRRDQLTVIDCKALAEAAPDSDAGLALSGIRWIPPGTATPPGTWLVAVSGLTQTITSTGYNQRVAECTEAARTLLRAAGRTEASPCLGQVSFAEYEAHRAQLAAVPARRARHFFTEMQRVQDGIQCWSRGDWVQFGRLMSQSGESSITNYECGSRPLIDLFEVLSSAPGIYGTRFSGAGFRGCCIALAEPEAMGEALPKIREAYARRQSGLADKADFLLCTSGDGAHIV